MVRTAGYRGRAPRAAAPQAPAAKKKSPSYKVMAVIVPLLVLALLFVMRSYVLKIRDIKIDGGSPYDAAAVEAAAGVAEGDLLYGKSAGALAANIEYALPYVRSVKISRALPSTLKISICSYTGAFYIKIGGDYYIIADNMKVLERRSEMPPELAGSLIYLKTGALSKCFAGETLAFSDPDIQPIVSQLYATISSGGEGVKIRAIDLNDKFNITLDYDGRLTVNCGTIENMDMKYKFLMKVAGGELYGDDKGVIDLSEKELSYSFSS